MVSQNLSMLNAQVSLSLGGIGNGVTILLKEVAYLANKSWLPTEIPIVTVDN
jgi:hypothetical protein